MTDADILTLMKSSLDEVAPGWSKGVTDFSNDVKFSELSIDSVQLMEMVGVIEDHTQLQFADEDLATLSTVGDMLSLVKKARA